MGNFCRKLGRGSCDAAQMAKVIQRHAFRRQNITGAPADLRHNSSRCDRVAVIDQGFKPDLRIDRPERGAGKWQTCDHTGLARHDDHIRHCIRRYRCQRGDVSCPAQILLQRRAHCVIHHDARQFRPVCLLFGHNTPSGGLWQR